VIETRVKDIQIQPIKGGGPLQLKRAKITPAGIETIDGKIKDHGLFAVTADTDNDGHHNFLTQRVQVDPDKNLFVAGDPRLALINPVSSEEQLSFVFNGTSSADDPGEENDNPQNVIPVQVWEYRGKAVEVPVLSEWLSDNLQRGVKVARTTGPWSRMSRQNFMTNNNPLRAQDGYPVHTVSNEDVERVFDAIGQPPDPNRFRYQLLLEGFSEFRQIHNFEEVEISGTKILQPKPCDRCEVTGIDQEKGEFSRIKPLAGIAKSGAGRWIRPDNGNKVHIMGENWLPQGEAVVNVGDPVLFTLQRDVPLTIEQR
jgi:uncharacterized protein YcbX